MSLRSAHAPSCARLQASPHLRFIRFIIRFHLVRLLLLDLLLSEVVESIIALAVELLQALNW